MTRLSSGLAIPEALRLSAERNGWSPTRVAATVNKSEQSARAWMKGATEMSAADYQTLRRELPGFADLVDGKAVA